MVAPFDVSRRAVQLIKDLKKLTDLPIRQQNKVMRAAAQVEHANIIVALEGDNSRIEAYLDEVHWGIFMP